MRAAAWLAVAAVAAWAAGDLARRPALGIAVALVVAALAVLAGWLGRRAAFRRRAIDVQLHTAAGVLGVQPSKVSCRGQRWRRSGRLARRDLAEVTIAYPPSANDIGASMREHMAERMAANFGGPVDVRWFPRTKTLQVRRAPPADADMARLAEAALAAFGPGTACSRLADDGAQVTAWEARYRASLHIPEEVRPRVAAVVASKTGTEWLCDWRPADDLVVFRRRPPLPSMVARPPDALAGSAALPVGVGVDGAVVAWDPAGACPHGLICGPTGTGKTILIRGLVLESARRGMSVVIVDPKRVSLLGLAAWPGVEAMATEEPAMSAAVAAVRAEVGRRYAAIEAGADGTGMTPLLLVVEELAELFQVAREAHRAARGQGDPPVVGDLWSIVRLGRECRVHVLVGIQRPDAAKIGGEMRSNLGWRVLLGTGATQAHRQMTEIRGEVSAACQGRAIVSADGAEAEVQVFWTPSPDASGRGRGRDRALLDALRPAGPPPPVLTAVQPPSAGDSRPGGEDPGPPGLRLLQGGETSPETGGASSLDGGAYRPGQSATALAEWIPSREAAARLGISATRLSQLSKAGRLHPQAKPGSTSGALVYDPAEVDALCRSRV